MSAVRPSPTTPGTFLCPRCGSALRDDQGWCVECGLAARTRVHPPPSWRLPVLLTCVVLALLAAGIAVALVTLLDTPESTPAPTTVTLPAATAPPATTPAPATSVPTTAVPTTPVPTTSVPGAATPTTSTPATTTPATPSNAPPPPPIGSDGSAPRTFTIPGTGITLPANATP